MPDSAIKLKPIRDILEEVLGDVEPLVTYSIGDSILEFWKPDHISERHHLRFVSVQVEQMVVGRQYSAILEKINELSDRTDIDSSLQRQLNSLTEQMANKLEELLPLNCQYLEALSELEPGSLLKILKDELAKRNPRKQVPMALFVNTLANKIREAMQPVEAETAEQADQDYPEEEENAPLELAPAATTVEALPASENNAKQLVSTSAT
jgi:hypothetical protein